MGNKILLLLVSIAFILIVSTGCTTSDSGKKDTKISMADFFEEYCDIYVNKFQSRDLESYGIEVSDNMDYGYYSTVDECVLEMMKIDKSAEDSCEQYGKANGIDCDEARLTRQEIFKKNMTQSGCIANGKDNRCALFDTTRSNWLDASAEQISDAEDEYTECLQKVEYACAELPEIW